MDVPVPAQQVGTLDRMPLVLRAYGALGALFALYVGALLLHLHGPVWAFADNWGVDGFELIASGLCLARALYPGDCRLSATILGSGLLGWSLGDMVWSIEKLGGSPPTPSLADPFYLSFYPLALVALALLLKGATKRPPLATWLDSVIAGLGVAAVTASFAFDSMLAVLVHSSLEHVNAIAVVLASTMLLAVLARSLVSFHHLEVLTKSKRLDSITDDLTGLGNRRLLMETLDTYFASQDTPRGIDKRLALLLLDLNHFKEINDSFGHSVGDEILKLLGPRLRTFLRSSDLLTRMGGDEFGIVLTGSDVDHASEVATRLSAELERPFALEIAELHVSASIGIAVAPQQDGNSGELMRCADVAMYRAKGSRHPYDVYDKSTDHGRSRIRRIEELRVAIDRRELELHYQPQYVLWSGELVGVEGLLRWPHSELGCILPDEFIPLAEEAGLMKPLTDLVLELAIAQSARWRREGHDVRVAVNLSTTNLLDDQLPGRILTLMDRENVPVESIVLELTESTLMTDRPNSLDVVQRLAGLGMQVSIDDFGTGFSSLAYLSDLAVSELKIDQSLIIRLADRSEQKNEAIVKAAIRLGHSLGLRVVAEGVENAHTYERLRYLGCDVAQGFYMARPTPPEDVVFHALLFDTPVG